MATEKRLAKKQQQCAALRRRLERRIRSYCCYCGEKLKADDHDRVHEKCVDIWEIEDNWPFFNNNTGDQEYDTKTRERI
jgi:hypothetical protein